MSSEPQQSDPLRPLASKASNGPAASREDVSRRKSSSKSRNGCVTCKARRVKCDETKPSCNQCARRRMTCGGYRKDIRFRPIQRPQGIRKSPTQAKIPSPQTNEQNSEEGAQIPEQPELGDEGAPHADFSSTLSPWPWLETEASDLSFLDSGFELPWNILSNIEATSSNDNVPNFERSIDEGDEENAHLGEELNGIVHDTNPDSFVLSMPSSPSLDLPGLTINQNLDLDEDSPEAIEALFNEQTRHMLSIVDEPNKNPWTTLVWPMAKDSKALFHALAAMCYLHLSKTSPPSRDRGLAHIQRSTQALAAELTSGQIQMDAALAATIALGFAETWDYQKTSTGYEHIKGARILLQQSLSNYAFSPPTTETSPRLKFLANTWIYMDVIARLTSDCGSPLNSELLSLFGVREPSSYAEELDPLMGYAATLFPIIGRVADLVREIRARNMKRNSPGIVSRAIELRNVVENWAPAIDLEHVDNPTAIMSDAIQTAEAYRWSTLLLLQQAVPEMPSLASVAELGQKTLIYIATIPITSHTTIVHTYPLMVAACEAADEEDRDFVRDRWQSMAKRMNSGIVDRCMEITEEVWRRRDVYFLEHVPSSVKETTPTRSSPQNPEMESPNRGSGSVGSDNALGPPARIGPGNPNPTTTRRFDFPISTAFRKGVDPITRSGNIEYTVKGRLHWLGVMKEWGWEVMLG